MILLLGTWLRFHALVQDIPLHPDEALFSTFARAAALNGGWMLPGPLDKPPLAIYLNALSQVFVGDSAFAARLPGALASALTLAAIYALAKCLYCDRFTPLLALLLAALSPFAAAYGAPAFTDGSMLMFITLGPALALKGRWGWAGVALGLGFASKQQALYFLPLLLALGWAHTEERLLWRMVNFCAALIGVMLLVWLWDQARGGTSIFALAAANNDPGRLIRANEVLPRLSVWLNHAQHWLGPGWLTALLLALALGVLIYRVRTQAGQRSALSDLVLFTMLPGYGFVHWLVAFNTYDRYLLPLFAPIMLLAARGLAFAIENIVFVADRIPAGSGASPARNGLLRPTMATFLTDRQALSMGLLIALLLPTALIASEGKIAINDDRKQYEGIDDLADYLNALPVATVIYDRWLGWSLGYYLGQWTDKRRVYYPTPDELVAGALTLDESAGRYLPVLAEQPLGPWLQALSSAGFGLECAYQTANFVVYRLIPPAVKDVSDAGSSWPDRTAWCAGDAQ